MHTLKQHPKLTAICACLLLCGVIVLIATPKSVAKAVETAKPAMTVTVISPAKQTWPVVVNANGNIEAWQESIIGAEIGGYVLAEVQAQIGDVVKRGQVLAQFSSDTLKIELAQQQAAVAEAESAWNEAADNAERIRKLDSNGALSGQQIKQSVLQEQAAAARLQAAKARLAAQQLRIKQSHVIAPDDGVISARSATVGAVVQPGQELFRLVRQSRLEWRAEVSALDAARIKSGQQASITLPNGLSVNGKVRKAAPTVDARTRNLLVYVDLQNTSLETAKPGMFAKGALQTGQGDVLTLPGNSIVMRDGFAYVFVLGADNKVKMQRVTLGRQDTQNVAVNGISKDAKIIASGAGFLADGDEVKVVAAK